MHNIDDRHDISDYIVKKLDKLANSTTRFKKEFNNLIPYHKERYTYIKTVEKKNAQAMSGVLNATKDVRIFDGLLESDKKFAFNTLDCVNSQCTLFKTLFSKLGQHREKYIKHVKGKKNSAVAMSGILNATKDTSIFDGLLKSDKEFAFNTLDCVSPQYTLFKTLFDKLRQHRRKYIQHIQGKKNTKAMSGVLNVTKDTSIFNGLLKGDKEFAFNTLDCINPTYTLFKTLFDKLGQHREEYIKHVKGKKNGAVAMSGILNATKDANIFNYLLKSDKEFAFNTLDCVSPQYTLFKTLFDKLGQYREKYIKHIQGKKNAKAMSGVLNVTKDTSIFNGLLKSDKEFAFNTLGCINPTHALFKTLFGKLGKQHKNGYVKHVKGKKSSKAMCGILNATKDVRIFGGLLKSDKEFAFNTLDCVNSQCTLFKTLFGKLGKQHKNVYIKHVKGKKNAKAMSGVLNVTKDTSIFNGLLKSDKEFAFNTLGCINPTHALFKTLFGKLGKQHKNGYVKHVKGKKSSKAMCGILNATKDVRIFGGLLKSDKEFAFNTLDCVNSQCTLFKTLFGKLDFQQKEDYKTHLEKKTTGCSKYVLKNFYSSDKRNSEKAISKGSSVDILEKLMITCDIPTTESVGSVISTLSNTEHELTNQNGRAVFEELEKQLPDELNESQSLENLGESGVININTTTSNTENGLTNQDMLSGFAALENQLSDGLNFIESQSLNKGTQDILLLASNEFTNQDMLAVFEELERQLPDELNESQSLENLGESGVININTTTSNTENGLTNQDMLSGFAALENQLSDGLNFIESQSLNRGTQDILLLASNEFTNQDMLAVFEELERQLPNELNFIGSRPLNKRTQDTFLSALEEFNAMEYERYELEGIHLEQPEAKRQRTE